jgi:hypothetical protein
MPTDFLTVLSEYQERNIRYADSVLLPLATTNVRVASIAHLIEIKKAAGRPKDLEDVNRLAKLRSTGNKQP